MVRLLKPSLVLSAGLFLAAMVAPAQTQGRVGQPGMVNYVEGQVLVNGEAVGNDEVGRVLVAPGQVLQTNDGKAEMLLTPGVFLRLDSNSSVKMVSPSLTNTKVELLQGKAMVEADQLMKENHIAVDDHGVNTVLKEKGVYEFNANNPMVAVYDGKVQVQEDDHTKDVGKGKELALTQNLKMKTESFNRKDEDDLYAWSKLRSEYMSEANMATAQTVVVSGPGWWYGPGWYWNPWFASYAWLPGDGFFYSPFGFGFYSPVYWRAYAPVYYRPGFGFVSRPGFGRVGVGALSHPATVAPAFRGGAVGGFHGGAVGGFHADMAGGLHAGGFGGFHGGGFGGRR
jgi:hypothetical protein